jgi:hypothetical protein
MTGIPVLRPARFYLQEHALRCIRSRELFNVRVYEWIFGFERLGHGVEGRRILGNVTRNLPRSFFALATTAS